MANDSATATMTDLDPAVEAETQRAISEWIERELGATVRTISRQDRWRPAWFVEAWKDGARLPLYLRGERNFEQAWPLETELGIIRILHEEGVPVPRIYGMCPNPRAIVMEWVEGTRDLSAYSDDQRLAIGYEYLEHLARLHAIDVRRFIEIGLPQPKTSAEIASAFIGPTRAKFASQKVAPDPFVAFLGRWVDGHRPAGLDRVSLVTGDPGQFLVKDGKITTLIDFEVCHLGSPLSDIACLRTRELEEPLADPLLLMKHYGSVSGLPIDAATMNYFQIVLAATTHFVMHPNFHAVRADLAIWRNWEIKASRQILHAMADVHGIELETAEPPRRQWHDHELAYQSLVAAIEALPAPAALDQFNRTNALALTRNLAAVTRLGSWMNEEELNDLEDLLGVRPRNLAESDALLETFVMEGGSDEALIRFFDRRFQRRRLTLVDHDPHLWDYDLPPLSRLMAARA